MAPYGSEETGVLFEKDAVTPNLGLNKAPVHTTDNFKWVYKWHFIILCVVLYPGALYGAYVFLVSTKWQTNIFAFILHIAGKLGITAGAHRLWTHRSYKAKWPLRLILATFQTLALQCSVRIWVLVHRTYHKYTDADPTNASRGFFYSHVGWLLVYEHPEYLRKSKSIDMSDIDNDPITWYQDKFYPIWATLAWFLPIIVPVYFWNESWTNGLLVFVPGVFRYTCSLHTTFLINSI